MPVTRDDVARVAGVSVATVSYVLNGGPRSVSDDKRRRVLRAVSDLGYRPNAIARSLRARRTRILGLVLPNSANPYFAALVYAIEEAATARGYQVIVANAAERPEREAAHIEALLRLQIDGLIWIPADLPRAGRLTPVPTIPTVQVDRTHESSPPGAGGVPFDVVEADNAGGGRLATEHLLALGHRRLACLAGPANHRHTEARLEGFRAALARALEGPLEWAPLVAYGDFAYASGAAIAAGWCALPGPERPTGIVCGNDAMAIGALSAIAAAGLHVPGDISVTGYDDLPQAAFTVPPLTTVAQPLAAVATAAVERLLARVEHPTGAPPAEHTVLPVRLVVRRSTGPAPAAPADAVPELRRPSSEG
jgi:LacI family transcriptional regulator